MSRNIDLGTFQWDSNKLTDQIAANFQEIQRLSKQLKDTKKDLTETGKAIALNEQKIESERRAQERLNTALQEGHVTQDEYNRQLEESNQVIDNLIDEQTQLIKAQGDYAVEVLKTQNEVKALNKEQNELNKLMQAGREDLDGSEGAYARLNNQLSEAKLEAKNLGAQLFELGQNVDKNSTEYQELAARYEEAAAKADELNDALKGIDKSVGDNQRSVGDYKDAITSAFSSISSGAQQLASGNIQEGLSSIKEGFNGIKTSVVELYAYMLANPLTAVFVGIAAITAGIVAGTKAIFDYNAEIQESVKQTQQLTGTSGQLADDIRNTAQALANTFGDDFNDVLKTANVLAKQLGITYKEAFDKIQEGYVRGANANGDFLERLSEYGPLLAKYGFNINEIIALQTTAQEQGIFSDKFEDSLKEAGLALEEFTKAQSDALTSAFGKEFSDKISKGVNSGALSVKDALLLMGNEAKKQGLSVQQWGILTADVFKGAGEDAGGAKKAIDGVYTALVKATEPYDPLQKKINSVAEAEKELERVRDRALKSDKVIEMQKAWTLFATEVSIAYYKFIGALTAGASWLNKTFGLSDAFFELLNQGQKYVNQIYEIFQELVGTFGDLATALGINTSESGSFLKTILSFFNPLKQLKFLYQGLTLGLKAVQFAIREVRVDLVAFVNTVKTIFPQIANAIKNFDVTNPIESLKKFTEINIAGTFLKARLEAQKAIAAQKELNKAFSTEPDPKKPDDKKTPGDGRTQAEKDAAAKAAADAAKKTEAEAKKAEDKRIADAKKAAEEAKKNAEEEAKRLLEITREAAEQRADVAKSELAQYIALNADRYKDDKTLLAKKLNDQLAYFDEVRRLQQQANNEEEAAKQLAVDQKIDEINKKKALNQNDLDEIKNLQAEKENISREYYLKELELNKNTNEQKKEIQKTFDEQVQEQKNLAQALEFQNKILALEAQGASEFEIQKLQLQKETEERLTAFLKENDLKRELDQENYDTNAEIIAQRKELELAIALQDDENEKLRLQNKLTALNLIEADSAESRKKIDKALVDQKLSGFATVFGAARQAFGEQTAVGKAAAVAETTINTYKAAQSAYSSLAGIPIIGPALGAAAAAFAVVQGLANVKKILSTKETFATGGIISGPSHAKGGVPISTPSGMIEAEGGEVIINKNSSRMFASELSAINQAGGGKKFANGGVLSSRLTGVQSSVSGGQDFTAMTEAITEAVAAGSQQGTATGSQQGIRDLNNNVAIGQGANF